MSTVAATPIAILAVHAYLEERLLRAQSDLRPEQRAVLRITIGLDEEEASDFVAGLEAGLFRIDDEGYATSPMLPPPSTDGRQTKLFQMFWHSSKGRFLFREGICQLAAASALVLKHGWPVDRVRLEPDKRDLGTLAYSVDIVAFDDSGMPVLLGEVKSKVRLLDTMIAEIRMCAKEPEHDGATCRRSSHRKFRACSELRGTATRFWAVAPGQQRMFRIDPDGAGIDLIETSDPTLLMPPN